VCAQLDNRYLIWYAFRYSPGEAIYHAGTVFVLWDKVGFFMMSCVVEDTLSVCTSPTLLTKLDDALKKKFRWKFL
jgi:hypothetical protein